MLFSKNPLPENCSVLAHSEKSEEKKVLLRQRTALEPQDVR